MIAQYCEEIEQANHRTSLLIVRRIWIERRPHVRFNTCTVSEILSFEKENKNMEKKKSLS